MSLFNFSQEEILTFFAVLVRFSVLIAILPVLGDRFVPGPAKVLMSLVVTLALFPALVSTGVVKPGDAIRWGASAGGILGTIGLECCVALVMGFAGKLLFESITFGGNLVGTFMGFAAASSFDPHTEAQTQVVAEVQMAIAMLIFLALDGHHLMLRAALDSYGTVGVGGASAGFGGSLMSQRLIEMTGQVFKFGIQLAAPVAIAMFAVNVVFAVVAKAMPQLNILVLSFSVTAMVGLITLFLSVPEFSGVTGNIFGQMHDWMEGMARAMAKGN